MAASNLNRSGFFIVNLLKIFFKEKVFSKKRKRMLDLLKNNAITVYS